jgi:glycosyltransferase involved in cell wall biosynthesis
MGFLKGRLRSIMRLAGKGEGRVASVFGVDAESSHRAVLHLRGGAPGVPVWLFTTAEPLPETRALCERVYLGTNAAALAIGAQKHLWQRWVAISVAPWMGRGPWAMKVAPFLTPPFRVVIVNQHGGFFSATPANVAVHCARAWSDASKAAWARVREAVHSARVGLHDRRVRAEENIAWAWLHAKELIRRAAVKRRDLTHGVSKLAPATALRMVSTLLRWSGHPHRALIRRMRGNQPLSLNVPVAEGDSVARFQQTGHEWDGDALETFARSTDARWILWQRPDELETLADAAVLFDDARTFAVSRQEYFRGWKPFLMATAPFRTLAPEEASRVMAPVANTMLIDRAKLLALGIPRCTVAGAAWLILFWKAAAAGFRSYSLGRGGALKELPEAPIQEAEFAQHVLTDAALRALCPRQEELSRGNIAFTPILQPSRLESGRMKVLIVSPFLPYPLSHGGAVRIFNLCRELSDRVDFSLVAVREAKDEVNYAKLHEVFREVHILDRDVRTAPDSSLPEQVTSSESASLRALIRQLCDKLLPDLVQFEYTHFAGFRDAAPGVPAILVEHDLTFSLYRQLAESKNTRASWREYQRWLAFERKWLAVYEGVWTVSAQDRLGAMEAGRRSQDRTFSIPNGVDIHRFRPTEGGANEIFYVGSFRHLPNIIGFEKLLNEVMPRVWSKAPEARLRVVAGPDHEFFWTKFGRSGGLQALDPRIQIHGFVEDLRPLYASAAVVVAPLEVSAGTNIKVLEAMASGRAIVSTPVGCAGLGLEDGRHLLVRGDWSEFADALLQVLANDALRAGLGANARRAAEECFSWKAIADRGYLSYQALVGTPEKKAMGVLTRTARAS